VWEGGWCRANTHFLQAATHLSYAGAVGDWYGHTHAEQADGNKRVDAEEALLQVDLYYGIGEVGLKA